MAHNLHPPVEKKLAELNKDVKFSPVRHTGSNSSECVMKEINKHCNIYCHDSQKWWPELIPFMENWMNKLVADSYAPVELSYNQSQLDLFAKLLNKMRIRCLNLRTYMKRSLQLTKG
jgi:hypothetical protein